MGSTDAKKAKKKKSRKVGRTLAASLSVPQTPLSTLDSEEIEQMTQLMDADDVNEVIVPAFSHAPNPFLSGHQCLLCRCDRPHLPKQNGDIMAGEDGSDGGSSVSQLPPWVCHECRKTVEEEEKRTEIPMSALLEPDLRLDAPVLPLLSEVGGSEPVTENGTLCQCKACTERRHIEAEQEREAQSLLHCWTELRYIIHCVYHQRVLIPTSSDGAGNVAVSTADIEKAKEFVHRLCVRDPHKLFQRVDEQGQKYVLEVKKRLLQQLAIGSKSSAQQAKLFLAMLLDEYANLCSTAKTLALILAELEQLHLKQFHVTCDLHSKHLFHALIYMEEDIQNRLHMLIPQLSLGSTGNEEVQDDTTSDLLQRYMKFDDEMSAVSVVWRECQQFIERYNDEQAVLTAKRKMLKEDWEFFKQQRKLLQQQQQQQEEEQTKCNAASPSSSPHTVELVEAQFTHMMERILQGAKPTTNEYHCPNCNRKRCPCDECSISHMITCGIINPDLLDQLHQPGAAGGDSSCMAAQVKFPSELYSTLNVRPPSMSSTCSSSGSESPIIIDPERLTLPFDEDTLDLGEDDLGEDEDSRSGNSDDESTADEDDTQQRRLDCAIVTTTSDMDREAYTMDKLDGLEHRASDLERAASYAASLQASNNTNFSCGFTQQPHTLASCECISCIFQPEAQQVRVAEESQCQCHACLQQQRQKQQQQQQQHGVATETTLPQHFPVLPQSGNQALHLYPHIHGANIMHPIVAAAAAVTTLQPTQLPSQHPHPLLQPQLYELHSPLPQQQLVLKAVTSCVSSTTATPTSHTHQQQLNHFGHYVDSKDVRLAVSNDKLYHACLGWDNATINGAHLMLSSQFNLPPSPPFANDISLVTHSSTAMMPPEDQFASVVPTSATPLFQQCTLATAPSTSSTSRLSGTQCGASVVFSAPVSGLDPRVPDMHAASVKRTLLNPSSQAMPIHNFTPVIGSSLPGSGDICMKHNPFMYMTNHSSLTSTPHTTTISTSQPTAATADVMKLNDDMMRSSGVTGTGCCDSIASMSHQDQMYALAHGRMQATGGTTKQMVNMSHVTRMQQQGCAAAPQGVPAPRSGPPPHHHTHSVSTTASGHVDANNVSDVSSTAGSMCLEADSCAHNDDNCDSNDDSCSEQSSSTSTSNQKDGKYCDCCYCEFFGHSTPPTLPTSRNYAEMRDRLRLRLKQRNEARTEKDKETLTPASPPKNEIVDQRELDELLRFINGAKDDAAAAAASPVEVLMPQMPTDNKATAKAAKRARQKQRKADEKAKKEAEEERQAKLERLRQLEQERAYQQLLKKKRSRHKEQQKIEAAAQVATPTSSSVPNGCNLATPGNKLRTVTVIAQAARSEKPHQSSGAVITTNGQLQLSSPGVTTSCAPSSCQASMKKSCQSVASAEYKSLRSNDCTAAPCASQLAAKPRRQQPQQADRVKKVAGKHQLQPGGSSSNNVENGLPKRTPSLKVKRSGDASDVQAQNRRNEQASHAAQTIGRPQQCGQAKVARHNCVAGSSAHKSSVVSNGPVASKSCTAANCSSGTGRGGVDNKNHHVASKEQTACLAHFMQQHQIGLFNTGPPAKTCHNATDTPLHSATNSVGRKKGYKLYQAMEPGSHHPPTQLPTPSVTPRSGRPTTCSNSNVGQRLDTGLSGHGQSSLANNHASLSVSSPAMFENQAWKLEKKAVPHKHQPPVTAAASRSKCDLERSPRTNEQNSGNINKNKKNRRKKATEDLSSLDEIFLPKEDVENGELDEFEREIEEFKRFCLDSTPAEKREKVQVTMNMKDIFSKKKSGLLA